MEPSKRRRISTLAIDHTFQRNSVVLDTTTTPTNANDGPRFMPVATRYRAGIVNRAPEEPRDVPKPLCGENVLIPLLAPAPPLTPAAGDSDWKRRRQSAFGPPPVSPRGVPTAIGSTNAKKRRHQILKKGSIVVSTEHSEDEELPDANDVEKQAQMLRQLTSKHLSTTQVSSLSLQLASHGLQSTAQPCAADLRKRLASNLLANLIRSTSNEQLLESMPLISGKPDSEWIRKVMKRFPSGVLGCLCYGDPTMPFAVDWVLSLEGMLDKKVQDIPTTDLSRSLYTPKNPATADGSVLVAQQEKSRTFNGFTFGSKGLIEGDKFLATFDPQESLFIDSESDDSDEENEKKHDSPPPAIAEDITLQPRVEKPVPLDVMKSVAAPLSGKFSECIAFHRLQFDEAAAQCDPFEHVGASNPNTSNAFRQTPRKLSPRSTPVYLSLGNHKSVVEPCDVSDIVSPRKELHASLASPERVDRFVANVCCEMSQAMELRSLSIHHVPFSYRHLVLLGYGGLQSMQPGLIQRISLRFCELDGAKLAPLISWIAFETYNPMSLHTLDLSDNLISAKDLAVLSVAVCGCSSLVVISLRNNPLTLYFDEAQLVAEQKASDKSMSMLRSQLLPSTPKRGVPDSRRASSLGDTLSMSIKRAAAQNVVQNLEIPPHQLLSSFLAACNQLESLDLGFCGLNDTCVVKVCNFLHDSDCSMRTLNIDGANITVSVAALLLDTVKHHCKTLVAVSLKYVYFCTGAQFQRKLCRTLRRRVWKELHNKGFDIPAQRRGTLQPKAASLAAQPSAITAQIVTREVPLLVHYQRLKALEKWCDAKIEERRRQEEETASIRKRLLAEKNTVTSMGSKRELRINQMNVAIATSKAVSAFKRKAKGEQAESPVALVPISVDCKSSDSSEDASAREKSPSSKIPLTPAHWSDANDSVGDAVSDTEPSEEEGLDANYRRELDDHVDEGVVDDWGGWNLMGLKLGYATFRSNEPSSVSRRNRARKRQQEVE